MTHFLLSKNNQLNQIREELEQAFQKEVKKLAGTPENPREVILFINPTQAHSLIDHWKANGDQIESSTAMPLTTYSHFDADKRIKIIGVNRAGLFAEFPSVDEYLVAYVKTGDLSTEQFIWLLDLMNQYPTAYPFPDELEQTIVRAQ